jgi:hypothetical protein
MATPLIGDVVLFQQNCQQYEHTGKVIAIFPGLFMVEELPVDPLGEPFGIMLSMDWWKIVARHGKPYVQRCRYWKESAERWTRLHHEGASDSLSRRATKRPRRRRKGLRDERTQNSSRDHARPWMQCH